MPNLYFGSYPESMHPDWDVILNVSDTPCDSLKERKLFYKTPAHYWMPVAEWGEFPYSAFYGVIKILEAAKGKKLIHCHGGICRSQLLGYSYLVYKCGERAERIWPGGVRQWNDFLNNRLVSKPPPYLLSFLKAMEEFPTYSVDSLKEIARRANR